VSPGLVGMTAGSPHPNAGLLFVEFMTSREGQQIFQKADYLPARPDVPPLIPDLIPETGGPFTGNVITPRHHGQGLRSLEQMCSINCSGEPSRPAAARAILSERARPAGHAVSRVKPGTNA